MLDLTKFDFWSVVAFVLPGMLIVKAFEFGKDWTLRWPGKDDLLPYGLVAVPYALSLWALGYALQSGQSLPSLEKPLILQIYVLWPILIGLFIGFVARYDVFRRLLHFLGVPMPSPPAPIRTPWPVIAPNIAVGTYLMVILRDKTIYRALVTEDSHLSSDQDRIDLYLGQTFEGDDWTPSMPQRAVYIRGSEIQSIEIWKFQEPAEKAQESR